MKRPLEILKGQIRAYMDKAAVNEHKTIQLSDKEFEAFKANFSQLCYEVQYGQLDEVCQELIRQDHDRTYHERDLNNMLIILDTIKATQLI